jgi:hypothetical protein
MSQIALDEELLSQARQAAEREGFAGVDDFIADAVAERVRRARRSRFLEATKRRHDRILAAGFTPEEILADFDRLRDQPDAATPQPCPPRCP